MNEYDRWKNRRKMAWLCMIAATAMLAKIQAVKDKYPKPE